MAKQLKCPKCKAVSGNDWSQCGGVCPMPMSPHFKDNREPYLDEDHLYNKYEAMKMANERNMQDKFKAEKALMEASKELQAIKFYMDGEPLNISTFIDEVTITYGYGNLDALGSWQYQLPQWFVDSPGFKHKVRV